MSKLVWDQVGERTYETGVDHGVLFPMTAEGTYDTGVAWSGLTAVTESPSGAEPTAMYADNIKYLNLYSAEDFGATIEALSYPQEFAPCNGESELVKGVTIGQQTRRGFGFSYRTMIGNDAVGTEYGYKIHLIYGAMAAPSEKANNTINENPEAGSMSWEVSTTPVNVTGAKPTAHLIIDSRTVDRAKLSAFEDIIYGTEEEEARLPLPDEVKTLLTPSGVGG